MTDNAAELWRTAHEIVQEQAEDEGLWFVAESISEAYLQNALRELHRAIEGEIPVNPPPNKP